MSDVARVAAGLSKAQRGVLTFLDDGPVSTRSMLLQKPLAKDLIGCGLVQQFSRFYALTPLGAETCAHLLAAEGEGAL